MNRNDRIRNRRQRRKQLRNKNQNLQLELQLKTQEQEREQLRREAIRKKLLHKEIQKNIRRRQDIKYDIYSTIANIVQFCYAIVKHYPNHVYCFVARDCYYIKQIFNRLFPDMESIYVIHSRKLCQIENSEYIKYISNIIEHNNNTVWIDGNGSGNSHYKFFSKSFEKIPPKYYLSLNNISNKESKFLFNVWGYYTTERGKCGFYDRILRSPEKSTVSLINGIWGYQERDAFEKEFDSYINTIFQSVVDNIWLSDKVRYRCLNTKIIQEDNYKYEGILAIDIDGTLNVINDLTTPALNSLVSFCNDHAIKITLITSRQIPYMFGSENNQNTEYIQDILERTSLVEYSYNIDLFYNPYAFRMSSIENAGVKISQLRMLMEENNLLPDNCILIDDLEKNITCAKKSGFTHSLHVKKGITQECLIEIMDIINK